MDTKLRQKIARNVHILVAVNSQKWLEFQSISSSDCTVIKRCTVSFSFTSHLRKIHISLISVYVDKTSNAFHNLSPSKITAHSGFKKTHVTVMMVNDALNLLPGGPGLPIGSRVRRMMTTRRRAGRRRSIGILRRLCRGNW